MSVAPQKKIRLDQPIDEAAPPTIYTSSLTPELADAALNLTIDFQRQKQSIANKHIIWHPYSLLIIASTVASFAYYKIGWIYHRGGFALIRKNAEDVFPIVIFFTMFASTFYTIASRPTDVIKKRADNLVDSNKQIFGFELKDLAQISTLDKKTQKELSKKSENSSLVIYRDSPIALISIVELPELTKDDTFVVKITGVGVRKVYYKSGIIDDLFDWVQKRAVELNNKKYSKILILIEVLSVDQEFKRFLTGKQFQYVETRESNYSKILEFFGIRNEIWGLPSNISTVDKIKSKEGSTGVSA